MKKTKIEWCDSTWNPVTGCLHRCEYCYANRIATRFGSARPDIKNHVLDKPARTATDKPAPYPYGFAPTFHRYRLNEPLNWKEPKTIFVCSMADLFGCWVPDQWIELVLAACKAAPQHTYLFLTKNPRRYVELGEEGKLPDDRNMWYGTTVTGPNMPFSYSDKVNTFISIEPILEDFHTEKPGAFPSTSWVIMGAETGQRKEKVVPEKKWITDMQEYCQRNGIPVFMKDSLVPIVGEENMSREFPWEDKDELDIASH